MHGPDGRDYQNRITFDEIVPPERIVYRHGGGEDVEPVQFTQRLTFEDLGGKTRLTWHGTFPSAEERARVIKEYGADKGLVQTMARLAEFVAGEGRSSAMTPRSGRAPMCMRSRATRASALRMASALTPVSSRSVSACASFHSGKALASNARPAR